jgi:hypothetical protein
MGPWVSGKLYRIPSDLLYGQNGIHPSRHPPPFDDGIAEEKLGYVCGCVSTRQLRLWFTLEQLTSLVAAGMLVVELEVPDGCVLVGRKYQCAFDRESAVLVRRLDPSDVYSN